MSPTSINRLTTAVSTWLLVEGIWGLVHPVVFGFLTTNRTHAVIHVLLALWGLKAAFTTGARSFLWALGVLLLLVGGLFFLPGGRQWTDLLAVNRPGAVLNLLIGLIALLSAAKWSR